MQHRTRPGHLPSCQLIDEPAHLTVGSHKHTCMHALATSCRVGLHRMAVTAPWCPGSGTEMGIASYVRHLHRVPSSDPLMTRAPSALKQASSGTPPPFACPEYCWISSPVKASTLNATP
eukprot:scaffold31794_cov107-Isochrysis_galbana.AAC.12